MEQLCFVVVLFYTCNNCFVEVSKLNYDPKTVSCVKTLFMDSFFKNAQETVGHTKIKMEQQEPTKKRSKLRCSGRVNSANHTSGTPRVTLVINPVNNHE
jgi:hypothetical protein